MPSAAFIRWQNDRMPRLNEVEAHSAAVLGLVSPNPRFLDETLRGYVLHLAPISRVSAAIFTLGHLNDWRNQAAHQGIQPLGAGVPATLTLAIVAGWRASCDGLAAAVDAIMYAELLRIMGFAPW